jgi:hypothetical protein
MLSKQNFHFSLMFFQGIVSVDLTSSYINKIYIKNRMCNIVECRKGVWQGKNSVILYCFPWNKTIGWFR